MTAERMMDGIMLEAALLRRTGMLVARKAVLFLLKHMTTRALVIITRDGTKQKRGDLSLGPPSGGAYAGSREELLHNSSAAIAFFS